MADIDLSRWNLVVHLKDGPERTVSLEFGDLPRLVAQLETFQEQRRTGRWGRRPGELYEFRNGAGDVIAFLDECFIRYEILDVDAHTLTADAAGSR